jgi:AcrR family transcriptional regulator
VPVEEAVRFAPSTCAQQERLLAALTELVADVGYQELTIGQLVTRAELSRQAFYRLFGDKDTCFLAAFNPPAQALLDDVRTATRGGDPSRASRRTSQVLIAFAAAEPETALMVLGESLRGGPRVRQAREQLMASIASHVDHAHTSASADSLVPDLPPRLICGVTCRLLSSRLRHGEPLDDLPSEIAAWLALYESPPSEHQWNSLSSSPPATRSPFLPRVQLRPPRSEARARGTAARSLADEDWLRSGVATAEIVDRDGYESATIGEIVRRAGVDSRAFYATFASKQVALAAAQELLFKHLMAVAAGAFVEGDTWPARLWEAARAVIQCAEQNALLSRVSLLEPCRSGASGAGFRQDVTSGFAMFLHEGDAATSPRLSQAQLKTVITAIGELALQHVQDEPAAPLTALLTHVAFLSAAPFVGTTEAAKLARRASPDGTSRRSPVRARQPQKPNVGPTAA